MYWRRQHVVALDHVDLCVPKGQVFGLLGPNGAGKTTLLRILAGLVLPDEGRALIDGTDVLKHPKRLRGRLTYVSGEERSLYWRLTGRENLKFYAVLNDVPMRQVDQRVDEVLSMVGLADAADERVAQCSSGIRQRLCLARGLLGDPDLLLLDEPTRSLDPSSTRQVWASIREDLVGNRGKTAIITTHDMEESRQLCSQVAIMHQGRVRALGTVDSLTSGLMAHNRYVISVVNYPHRGIDQLRSVEGVCDVHVSPSNGHQRTAVEVTVKAPELHMPGILAHLLGAGVEVVEVVQAKASIGDAVASVAD